MALLGIRRRTLFVTDTCQVGIAFVPASFLSFKPVPEITWSGVERQVRHWRGRSNEPRKNNIDLSLGPLPDKHLLITRIPYSTCLHYRCVTGVLFGEKR